MLYCYCFLSLSQHHDWFFPVSSKNATDTQVTNFFIINVRPGKSVLCNDMEVADVIRLIT
jgi:hypothetical protein